MKILALETSTEYCSVALYRDGELSERCELAGQKHSEILIAMVDKLLHQQGETLAQLDAIAYGQGPGSFTGVRIACGAAQGLALGADLPLVGIVTLLALAQSSGKEKVIAALDARMNEIYLAAYEKRGGEWQAVLAPCLCKIAQAPAISGTGWYGVGSGFALEDAALAAHYEQQLDTYDPAAVPGAGAIAELAAAEFARGNTLDAAAALPFYLRDKVALKTAERGI